MIKKKTQLSAILQQMRSQDDKKRILALNELRQVAITLGPQRTRTQLIPFLNEFLDDEEAVVLALLHQLNFFPALFPGLESSLIPLLLNFCKTDQLRIGLCATQILKTLLVGSAGVEAVVKLAKTAMVVAKECAIVLILAMIAKEGEGGLIAAYCEIAYGDMPGQKIIASKYLDPIMAAVKNKEEISKVLDNIYNQTEELTKIYALPALINYYQINQLSVLSKLKNLFTINSWRINIKILKNAQLIAKKINKMHFKQVLQPFIIKMLSSPQPQVRASSCKYFHLFLTYFSEQQFRLKVLPSIKKLSCDPINFVKLQLASNIFLIGSKLSSQQLQQHLLPLVYSFMRECSQDISLGVVRNIETVSCKISPQIFQQKIMGPLLNHLKTQNWRIRLQILSIVGKAILLPNDTSERLLRAVINLSDDHIDAVRLKVNETVVEVIKRMPKEWTDAHVIPKVTTMRESSSYFKRQNYLDILDKTAMIVSDKTLKDVYQNGVLMLLGDKVPNVRLKGLRIAKENAQIQSNLMDKAVDRLKQDKDSQVREMAKKFRA